MAQRGDGTGAVPIDISVCVATHNRADRLGPLIERTSRLAGANIELVIIDDGSSDDTRAVLDAAQRSGGAFRLDGRMIDEPLIAQARSVLRRAEGIPSDSR